MLIILEESVPWNDQIYLLNQVRQKQAEGEPVADIVPISSFGIIDRKFIDQVKDSRAFSKGMDIRCRGTEYVAVPVFIRIRGVLEKFSPFISDWNPSDMSGLESYLQSGFRWKIAQITPLVNKVIGVGKRGRRVCASVDAGTQFLYGRERIVNLFSLMQADCLL